MQRWILAVPRTSAWFLLLFYVAFTCLGTQLFFLPLRLLHRPTWRAVNRMVESWWASYMVWVTENFSPSDEFVLVGDEVDARRRENVVAIANHQIYADWWYLWWVAHECGREGDVKIILKHQIKLIPIFGWAMSFFEFLFLHRNWKRDAAQIDRVTREYTHMPLWLLLFPEGTVHTTEARPGSVRHAERVGAYMPRELLLPRVAGIHAAMKNLREHVSAVYDFTIGYDGLETSLDAERVHQLKTIFFFNSPPKRIQINIHRINIADIPTELDEFSTWLYGVFERKDKLMQQFFKTGTMPGGNRRPLRRKASMVPLVTASVVNCIVYSLLRQYVLPLVWA